MFYFVCGFGNLSGSMSLKDFVRYHLNYPSYIDLPLGGDPLCFWSPSSYKKATKTVDTVL